MSHGPFVAYCSHCVGIDPAETTTTSPIARFYSEMGFSFRELLLGVKTPCPFRADERYKGHRICRSTSILCVYLRWVPFLNHGLGETSRRNAGDLDVDSLMLGIMRWLRSLTIQMEQTQSLIAIPEYRCFLGAHHFQFPVILVISTNGYTNNGLSNPFLSLIQC